VWRFILRSFGNIKDLETLSALIKLRVSGAVISQSPSPYLNAVDVKIPYKIRGSTLRELRFGDYSNDLTIEPCQCTLDDLTPEEREKISVLFKW